MKFINVPENERTEYNTSFEQLYRHVSDMDNKMHIYASFMKEEVVRKLIAVVCFFTPSVWYLLTHCFVYSLRPHTINAPLSSSTPTYFIDLKTVKSMTVQTQVAQKGLQMYIMGLGVTGQPSTTLSPDAAADEVVSDMLDRLTV